MAKPIDEISQMIDEYRVELKKLNALLAEAQGKQQDLVIRIASMESGRDMLLATQSSEFERIRKITGLQS